MVNQPDGEEFVIGSLARFNRFFICHPHCHSSMSATYYPMSRIRGQMPSLLSGRPSRSDCAAQSSSRGNINWPPSRRISAVHTLPVATRTPHANIQHNQGDFCQSKHISFGKHALNRLNSRYRSVCSIIAQWGVCECCDTCLLLCPCAVKNKTNQHSKPICIGLNCQ